MVTSFRVTIFTLRPKYIIGIITRIILISPFLLIFAFFFPPFNSALQLFLLFNSILIIFVNFLVFLDTISQFNYVKKKTKKCKCTNGNSNSNLRTPIFLSQTVKGA